MTAKKLRWSHVVDFASALWLLLFAISLTPMTRAWVEDALLVILLVFVADLCVLYVQSNLRPYQFVRSFWVEIILLIPYFRIFRILRVGRFIRALKFVRVQRLSKLLRFAEIGVDSTEVVEKIKRLTRR